MGGDLDNMMAILLVISLGGAGIYCLYTAIKLKKEGCLFPNKLLYPGNCAPEDCVDEVGFISYILPRITLFGIGCLLFAVLVGLNINITFGLPNGLDRILLMVLGLLMFVWYIFVLNKAAKRYW